MIDFDKYDIGYLKMKPVNTWCDDDFGKLFNALVNEQAAPIVDLPFITENIEALLSVSYCRKCGKCCKAGTMDGEDASVMTSQNELEAIAEETNASLDKLKAKLEKHPTQKDCWSVPLPCMFYENEKCGVYNVRPKVCHTYRLAGVTLDDITYTAINLGCDYGRDIYTHLLKGE
jgi:Fe-S-cluster containining protein